MDNVNPLLGVVFFLGILVQAFFLVYRNRFARKHTRSFNLGTLGMIFLVTGFFCLRMLLDETDLYHSIFFSGMIFASFFSIMYFKDILSNVNEQKILQLNLIVIYLMISMSIFFDFKSGFWFYPCLITLIVGTIGTLIISYTNNVLNFLWKVSFYVWFTILNLILIFFQAKNVIILFSSQGASIGYVNMFVLGLVFMLLIFNAMLILELIPLPGKHQTMRERIEEVKAHARLLSSRYSDEQVPWKKATLIILIYSVILGLNLWLNILDSFLLTNILLLLVFYYDYYTAHVSMIL